MSSNATVTDHFRHDDVAVSHGLAPELATADLTPDDLLVQDSVDVKGGPGGGFGCTWCGGTLGNHNESVAQDGDVASTEPMEDSIEDLLVVDSVDVKGGPGGGFGCTWCGGSLGNHNEVIANDDGELDDSNSIDDLLVVDADQVKGGPGSGFGCTWCGGTLGNHNETTASDDDEALGAGVGLDDLLADTH